MVDTIEFSWGSNSAALHVWKHSCKSTTVSPALPCWKWSDMESDWTWESKWHWGCFAWVVKIEFSQGCKSAALHRHEWSCVEITLCGKWEITWQWDLFIWSLGWMKSHKFIKMHSCYDRRRWRSDNQLEENGSQAAVIFIPFGLQLR